MAIAEMQRSSEEYKTDKVVYTIAVFTGKYVCTERNGKAVERDILFHHSNLFDIEGKEFDVFGHKLIFLNHHYIKDITPQGYKDWLNLIRESIKNPKNPTINLSNQGVKKVAELIDYEHLSPEEMRETKNSNAAKSAKAAYEYEAKFQEKIKIALNAILEGFDNKIIAKLTGLTIEQIEDLRNKN